MEIEAYHKLLEDKFLTYQELALIDVKDNGEPMVALPKEASFRVLSIDQRMEKYTGKEIFVRQSLVKKIQAAQEILMTMIPDGMLEVVYGYRHLSIQMEAYEDIKKEIVSKKEYADETDLKEEVHHFIAVPEVSGHPTGGAIDIRITDTNGRPFDMGTNIHEFVKDSYVHTPFISKAAWHNRQLSGQNITESLMPYMIR